MFSYKIVTAPSSEILEEEVEDLLVDWWDLVPGGFHVVVNDHGRPTMYVREMVKKHDPPVFPDEDMS